MLGSLSYSDYYEIRYFYPNNNTYYTANIDFYKYINNNSLYFNIPKSFFTDNIVIRTGSNITFDLIKYHRQEPAVTQDTYYLGTYTLNLSSQEQQEINEDSDKQLISDLKQEQQQTTQAVENLENTITDTNISDDSISFPTLDVPDLARDGLTHIFDAFVLAFCSDTPEDIILPIPNTNKTITIPYNYTSQMLTNYSPTLLNLITLFWWYWIARIIVFDIYDKMDKIQSGNVENLQNENITTNML